MKDFVYINLPKTSIYIETGTYRGRGVAKVLSEYSEIHTIELSKKWFDFNVEKWSKHKHVNVHFGDSKVVLSNLLDSINQPVTIFLDAHYSGKHTAMGEEETPILKELELLQKRDFDDLILIDDCRMLGKSGRAGNGSNIYPFFNSNWSDITLNAIKSRLKPGYKIAWNGKSKYNDRKILKNYKHDVLIIYKNG